MHTISKLLIIAVLAFACATCAAQDFDFPATPASDDGALSAAMPKLARDVIAVYRDDDRAKYLDNLFRLQMVAGRYADAIKTIDLLRALPADSISPQARAAALLYGVFARAKAGQGSDQSTFDSALQVSLRAALAAQDDRNSAMAVRALNAESVDSARQAVSDALQSHKAGIRMPLADALALIKAYQVQQAFRSFAPLAESLTAEEDHRRYIFDNDIKIKTPDGATVCALVMRPRAAGRLPALLLFSIYYGPFNIGEARRTASNGYVGVVGFSRGIGCSPDQPVAFEHDGADADALIDWISRQPWSDGRVGMYGGSYTGFAQWAATKHRPKALQAIMPSVTGAPGIDTPMEGGVHQSFSYYWPLYTTSGHELNNAALNDRARWNKMMSTWYASGKAYRSMDAIDGTPNPVWDRWLAHPDYDAYWQGMIPYAKEFADIDIPVLTTTGYYDGAQVGALYYCMQHYKYRPAANHFLVIGPYDHISGQRGILDAFGDANGVLQNYDLDPVANIDIGELRYQWFDHVFKGGAMPALLGDKVNYQVMGANVWKHAPSLAAMANATLRLHLGAERAGEYFHLGADEPGAERFVTQKIDLADRSDVDRVSPSIGIVDKHLDSWNGVAFVSDPMEKPTEFSGLFSGKLDFIANRKDLDFNMQLYELTPKGDYISLSWYLTRASYAQDRSHRHLLTPGKRQTLPFTSGRLTSRLLQPGSKLIVLLMIVKERDIEINYGSGKPVSDETIADAKPPLQIEWYNDSYIDVPVWTK